MQNAHLSFGEFRFRHPKILSLDSLSHPLSFGGGDFPDNDQISHQRKAVFRQPFFFVDFLRKSYILEESRRKKGRAMREEKVTPQVVLRLSIEFCIV